MGSVLIIKLLVNGAFSTLQETRTNLRGDEVQYCTPESASQARHQVYIRNLILERSVYVILFAHSNRALADWRFIFLGG